MENSELRHYNIKGSRWGQRRFQNKDGSLTPLGRLRYARQQKKTQKQRAEALKKARQVKAEKQAAAARRSEDLAKGKIKIKDMTDEEIKARTARLQMEKTLRDLERESELTSKGRRFINKFADSTVDKIAESVGADLVAQALKSVAADTINKKVFGGTARVYDNNKKKG